MNTRIPKVEENKSRSVANSVAQKKSNVRQGFGDNRKDNIKKINWNLQPARELNKSNNKIAEMTSHLQVQRKELEVDKTVENAGNAFKELTNKDVKSTTYQPNIETGDVVICVEFTDDWQFHSHYKPYSGLEKTTIAHFYNKDRTVRYKVNSAAAELTKRYCPEYQKFAKEALEVLPGYIPDTWNPGYQRNKYDSIMKQRGNVGWKSSKKKFHQVLTKDMIELAKHPLSESGGREEDPIYLMRQLKNTKIKEKKLTKCSSLGRGSFNEFKPHVSVVMQITYMNEWRLAISYYGWMERFTNASFIFDGKSPHAEAPRSIRVGDSTIANNMAKEHFPMIILIFEAIKVKAEQNNWDEKKMKEEIESEIKKHEETAF